MDAAKAWREAKLLAEVVVTASFRPPAPSWPMANSWIGKHSRNRVGSSPEVLAVADAGDCARMVRTKCPYEYLDCMVVALDGFTVSARVYVNGGEVVKNAPVARVW